jgi:putative transposase
MYTVLAQLLYFVPRHAFQKLVDGYQGDKHTRSLTCWNQFVALLVGQLSEADSLRRLVEQLDVHSQRHYHLGLQSVRKSTLAGANHKRSTAAYHGLFFHMLSRLSKSKGLADVAGQVQLIDSTTISLSQSSYQWASFRRHHSGIKVPLLYDPNAQTPIYFEMTPANVSDSRGISQVSVVKGVTYVFDRAYNGGQWLEKLADEGCIFVGRMKKDMTYEVVNKHQLEGKGVIRDEQIRVVYKTRQWLKNQTLRRIVFNRENDGKELVFFTNDLNRSALEIADLYKQRWQIELFFKWIKQNLKIKRFYGTSENAVKLQVLAAMISYVSLRLIKESVAQESSLLNVWTRIKAVLMTRMTLAEVFKKPPDLPDDHVRLELLEN